ncbi:MAG: hypothetical protein Aurels2KO_14730 [Aureliella sp.]
MPQDEKRFSLKDELFNKSKVVYLAGLLSNADASFDKERFVKTTMKGFLPLELKARIGKITDALEECLDDDFRKASDHLIASLPPPLDPKKSDDDFGDFIFAPYGEFVVRRGLSRKHLKRSLKTLKEFTKRFSMEYAIRDFINEFPNEALSQLEKWAADSNYHVRRLVSEGTRPILPWSKRLTIDPLTPLPLLDVLHADRTRYVTRSVANHLNDVSKSDAPAVLARLKQWKKEARQEPAELAWMARHAMRTLVKQGDQRALKMLGFRDKPRITVETFALRNAEVRPGEAIEFDLTISASREESLLVDYVVDFVKANGKLSPKVHKLKQLTIGAGETASLSKRHPLRANATTYKLYPGTHRVTLQINGSALDSRDFELVI